MSTFLGELGKGMMQLGKTYGDTRLANLEADAQRMKEERLQMIQMAQFGMQGTKDIYQMEMGEKKFALLEDEAARKAEESEYQKSLRGKGTWENKTIYPHGRWVSAPLEADKYEKGPPVEVRINSLTGEMEIISGSTQPPPVVEVDGEVLVTGTMADFRKHAKAHIIKNVGEDAATESNIDIVVANGLKSGAYKKDGETQPPPPPPPEVDRKLVKDYDELNKMFPTPGADMGEAFYTKQLIPDLGTKIAEGTVTAAEAITDPRVMSAVYGYPVDVVTWFINQFLPADMVIDKPALGSKMWGEWLEALAPHYEKGKQLTKEEILKFVPSIDLGQGSLEATYKGDRDEKVLDAIDRWNQFSDIEKASRLKKWGDVDKATDKTLKGSSAAAKIAQFIAEPVESIASALEGLPSKAEIIKIVESWPTPDKVKPKDVPTIKSVIDAVKAEIDGSVTASLIADTAKDTTDYWKTQIGNLTTGNTSSGVDTTTAVGTPDFLPGRPPLNADPATDGLILTGDAGDMARQQTAVTGIAPELPPELPPERLAGEMPTGSLTDGPLDEVIISQMPYDSLVTLFNNAQEMVRVGVGKEEAEILFTNMELIKSELRTREPPAATPELPPELPIGFGQDDPRIDDGQSLLDTKVLLDPTQMHRRIDYSRGRQGEGGLSMDADYRTLPGTLSRKHGQDDPQDAGTMNRAEIKALLDPTQRHRQEGIIGATEPTDLLLGASYDPNLEQGVKTLQQIAKESGEEMGTSEVVLKKIMPDITKFVDKVKKAVADDASTSAHTKLLRGIEAAYYKVADEISKDNYLKVLTAEMEKAGVADRKPGDFIFKYSTAVIGTLVDGVKWIDENIPTLYKPSGDILYKEGSLIEGIKKKGDVAEAETDILKMDYDESIEHIRNFVKGIKGNNSEVIDRLFQLNGILQEQEGFKKTDYNKALREVMIGLHTTPEKYK